MRGDVMKKYFISTVLFLVSLCGIFSCKNNNDVAKLEDVKIIIKASNEIICCNAYTGIKGTEVVASKEARFLGLFDMSGNVAEWVFDKFGKPQKGEFKDPAIIANDKTRIVRGGSWHGEAEYCCVGSRIGASPNARLTNLGFRIAFYK